MSSQTIGAMESDELDIRFAGHASLAAVVHQQSATAAWILGILSVLIPWELAARLGWVKAVLIGSPSAVWQAAVAEVQLGSVWNDIGATLQVFALGYFTAAIIGIGIGWRQGGFAG